MEVDAEELAMRSALALVTFAEGNDSSFLRITVEPQKDSILDDGERAMVLVIVGDGAVDAMNEVLEDMVVDDED